MSSNSMSDEEEARKFWNAIKRLGSAIQLNPELGDKFTEAFKIYLVGENPKTESDYLTDYEGFWNEVYEISPDTFFPNDVRKFIKEDYELPNNAHATGLGMLLTRLAEQTQHRRILGLCDEMLEVYYGLRVKKE